MIKFTNAAKYRTEWFGNLPPRLKLLWYYLNDVCDHAGVWERNFKLLNYEIGETGNPYTPEDLVQLGERIIQFSENKYLLRDYLVEQNPGGLRLEDSEDEKGRKTGFSRIHRSYLKVIESHGLIYNPETKKAEPQNLNSVQYPIERSQIAYPTESHRLKDKEKDKDTDKESKERGAGKTIRKKKPIDEMKVYPACIEIYDQYIRKRTESPAKINKAEGDAMNQIIEHLERMESRKLPIPDTWRYILDNLHKCELFISKQIKLTQINSNLITIFDQLRNGNHKQTNGPHGIPTPSPAVVAGIIERAKSRFDDPGGNNSKKPVSPVYPQGQGAEF